MGEPGGPYRGRSDIFAGWGRSSYRRDVLNELTDLPNTRIAAYDREVALYDALARAHAADDPAAADVFASYAAGIREARDKDRAIVTGDGPAANLPTAAQPAAAAQDE